MSSFEIGLLIAMFGLVMGIIVAVISFFLKRLINSVDELKTAMTLVPVELEKRPTWTGVKDLCIEVAESKVIKHERDQHRIDHPPVEEFNQIRRT